jgi:hypothetical protein
MNSDIIKFILLFLVFVINIMIACLFALAGGNYCLIIIYTVLINLYNILTIIYILSDLKED